MKGSSKKTQIPAIIDAHTHVFNQEKLESYLAKLPTVKKIVVMAWFRHDLSALIEFAGSEPKLAVVGTVSHDSPKPKQIRTLEKLFKQRHVVGAKLYPGYQNFLPTDDWVHEIALLCQEYNKPLVFHSGDINDTTGRARLRLAHPLYVDDLAAAHPECPIVISHFGFPFVTETANILSIKPNVYTDISGTLIECDTKSQESHMYQALLHEIRKALAKYQVRDR